MVQSTNVNVSYCDAEGILNTQWFPTYVRTPEHKLLLALLEDALRRYLRGVTKRRPLLVEEEARWINSDAYTFDGDHGVSFCAACDKLYLDPDAVRQRLRAICQQPQCPPAHARE